MRGILQNKKAGVHSLISWMPASFIVFLIMIVFVALVAIIVVKNGFGEINLEKSSKSADIHKLYLILNSPVDNGNVKDLILKWSLNHNNELEEKIKFLIEDILKDEKRYVFRVKHFKEDKLVGDIKVEKSLGEYAFGNSVVKLNLFLDKEVINLELYKNE